ncbi:hypothetical protein [Actinobaculum sp. 352]|uniref:hypothetical protein n=1 Tax=Actinobaculum sp. 352 TaxID=2490946 RepID=UPI001F498398|nr:hypothetical protein [Actinobaculum sp. 352]
MGYSQPFIHTAQIDSLCMDIAELIGRLGPDPRLSTNPHLRRETRIQTIHSSLLIEGNSLSHQDVTAIINGERVLGPPSDIREVENANRAYTHEFF